MERRAVPLRRPHVRAHRQADRGIPRRSGGVQSGWRDARHRRGRVRARSTRAADVRWRTLSSTVSPPIWHSRTTVHDSSSSTARVLAGWASAWITILDSSTLQQAGSIYPEGFEGRWVSQERAVPCIALTAGDSLITASSERGEPVWWDLDTGRKEKTLEIDHGYGGYRALGRSPDGRTVAVGLSRGFGLVDVRTGPATGLGAPCVPHRPGVQPDGGTVVSTNVDVTVAVWDAETATLVDTLHGHSGGVAGRIQPGREDALHRRCRRDGHCLGPGRAQGLVRRQFTFTHDRGLHNWPDIHPGRLSTNGVIAVGLEDRGSGSSTSTTSASRVPACSTRATRSTRLAISPDGQTVVALSNDADYERATATVWDVESRSLRYEPIPVPGDGVLARGSLGLGRQPPRNQRGGNAARSSRCEWRGYATSQQARHVVTSGRTATWKPSHLAATGSWQSPSMEASPRSGTSTRRHGSRASTSNQSTIRPGSSARSVRTVARSPPAG